MSKKSSGKLLNFLNVASFFSFYQIPTLPQSLSNHDRTDQEFYPRLALAEQMFWCSISLNPLWVRYLLLGRCVRFLLTFLQMTEKSLGS